MGHSTWVQDRLEGMCETTQTVYSTRPILYFVFATLDQIFSVVFGSTVPVSSHVFPCVSCSIGINHPATSFLCSPGILSNSTAERITIFSNPVTRARCSIKCSLGSRRLPGYVFLQSSCVLCIGRSGSASTPIRRPTRNTSDGKTMLIFPSACRPVVPLLLGCIC